MSNAVKNRVSLIIVTHNSLPALKDCLLSLRGAVKGQDFELFLVDNRSDDQPDRLVKDLFPSAQIIHNEENIGFGAACNRGAFNASGEFLLFINPDVKVDSGIIDRLREVHQDNPKIGLSAARCRLVDGSFHP
ncbi:MAG: glycosyltransferase, partial [Candidatus Zixiibacteriota bacterium]